MLVKIVAFCGGIAVMAKGEEESSNMSTNIYNYIVYKMKINKIKTNVLICIKQTLNSNLYNN